jgi:hypothetical protein
MYAELTAGQRETVAEAVLDLAASAVSLRPAA